MNVRGAEPEGSGQWAPVSDLMSALMLIFMFIAIIFIRTVIDAEAAYKEECDKIYQVLRAEFIDDFADWDVELLEDLTIRFRNPEVLFESGSDQIRPRFDIILRDFFPRYMAVVRSDEYKDDIREIRIEGHTSSTWVGASSVAEAYYQNMNLSQMRTLSILKFLLDLPETNEYLEWAKSYIMANGLSSSRLIRDEDGEEDVVRSRRVEFRLMTSSCQRAGVYERVESQDEN